VQDAQRQRRGASGIDGITPGLERGHPSRRCERMIGSDGGVRARQPGWCGRRRRGNPRAPAGRGADRKKNQAGEGGDARDF
jgi:hypothetical protein